MSAESKQLLVISFILVAIGLAFLFSASAVPSEMGRSGDPMLFLKKQLLWAAIAVVGMAACSRIPVDFWRKASLPLWIATLVMLALCFVPVVGAEINGAHRWLKAAGWFVQPSEVSKLTLLMLISAYAANDAARLRSFGRGFVPAFGAIAITCGLILPEPDIGTAAFIGLIATTTLIVSGARLLHVVPTGIAAAAGGIYVALKHPHVLERMTTFLHPDADPLGKGLQIHQSMVALGSGGWFGTGLGRGEAKLWYLPEVHSDFILPLIGQEVGFLGTGAVLLLFAALGLTGWRVARKAATPFGAVLSFGLTLSIIVQAAMNIAVVTASMPTKGIPLPFVSAGGSSLVFTLCGIGILMSAADGRTAGEPSGRGEAESCDSSLRAAEPGAISSPA